MFRAGPSSSGFSLIELMVVLVIFLIVTAAVFGLLNVAQVRYRSEQQFLDSLQGARTGLDQITRDIHRAGYPALNAYDTVPQTPPSLWTAAAGVPVTRIAVPIVGYRAGNIDQTCIVDTANPALSTCVIPGPFELILEADLDPENTVAPEQVEWVYYRVDTPGNALVSPPNGGGADPVTRTLYRAVKPKVCGGPPWITSPMTCTPSGGGPGGDPRTNPTPFVDNVLNDPALYAGDPNEAVFRYRCADMNADGVPDTTCTPENIAEVYIVLRARAYSRDLQTRQIRALTLQSVAQPLNPPQ